MDRARQQELRSPERIPKSSSDTFQGFLWSDGRNMTTQPRSQRSPQAATAVPPGPRWFISLVFHRSWVGRQDNDQVNLSWQPLLASFRLL